jgi:Flp pilus assembly protein TadB
MPDRNRGRARRLSPRAAEYAAERKIIDRRARFDDRLEQVREGRERRSRRRRIVEIVAIVVALAGTIAIGAAIAGAPGALLGAALVFVAALATVVVRRGARRRGAAAWDWQSERHRLLGRPADRVYDPSSDGLLDRLDPRGR